MPTSRRGRPCRSPGTRTGRTPPTIWPWCSTSSSSCTATAALATTGRSVTGFAKLDQHKVLVVGHQKGRTYKERSACYFGCAHPGGLPQGDPEDEAGREVRPADHLLDRHARRLSGHRRRGARPGAGDRREHVRDVAAADADHLRRDRRRGHRRGAGDRRRRPRGDARVRLLLGDQPRRLRRHSLEEPPVRRAGGRRPSSSRRKTCCGWAWSTT